MPSILDHIDIQLYRSYRSQPVSAEILWRPWSGLGSDQPHQENDVKQQQPSAIWNYHAKGCKKHQQILRTLKMGNSWVIYTKLTWFNWINVQRFVNGFRLLRVYRYNWGPNEPPTHPSNSHRAWDAGMTRRRSFWNQRLPYVYSYIQYISSIVFQILWNIQIWDFS